MLGSVIHYIMGNEHNQGVPRKHLMHARRVRQGFRECDEHNVSNEHAYS